MTPRRHDVTGRSTGIIAGSRRRKANQPPADQPWIWLPRDLLESPAWRAMSDNARRLLDRVMIEHMGHGGAENGCLPVTYDDLVSWGIRRNSISPSIAEASALGLLEHQPGRAGRGEGKGHPQTFTLCWLPTLDGDPPTDRWRRFADLDQARQAGALARASGPDGRHNARRRASRGAV